MLPVLTLILAFIIMVAMIVILIGPFGAVLVMSLRCWDMTRSHQVDQDLAGAFTGLNKSCDNLNGD